MEKDDGSGEGVGEKEGEKEVEKRRVAEYDVKFYVQA